MARRASASRSDFFSNSVRSQAHSTNAMQAASDKAMKRFMMFPVPDFLMAGPLFGGPQFPGDKSTPAPDNFTINLRDQCRTLTNGTSMRHCHDGGVTGNYPLRVVASSYFLILSYSVLRGIPS